VALSKPDRNSVAAFAGPATFHELRLRLFNSIDHEEHFNRLFDYLPDVHFFAKDREGRILFASSGLVRLYGYSSEESFIGRTDFELLPRGLAEKFRKDDLRVISTGLPMIGIVELFPNAQGVPDWFLTDKLPLRTSDGKVMGVMGTIRGHRDAIAASPTPGDIDFIVDDLKKTFALDESIASLAERCRLSIRQFESRFKARYNLTPSQFRIRLRITKACELLRTTQQSVANVAVSTGFYDQSALSYHFKAIMGSTPLQYRKMDR
jgi:PAS domain S-box-containing protein